MNKMKTFLVLFVLLFSSSVFAETYYCVEEGHVGFDRSQKMKMTEFNTYNFKIDIDYELQKIKEDKNDYYFGFISAIQQSCVVYLGIINCINDVGSTFIFSEHSQVFYSSSLYLRNSINPDDVWMSYGSCSKF